MTIHRPNVLTFHIPSGILGIKESVLYFYDGEEKAVG